MNAKTYTKNKTIPAFKRLIENLEAGASPLIIRDIAKLFVDSYYRMVYGDNNGVRYYNQHSNAESREDVTDGIKEFQNFLKDKRCSNEYIHSKMS